MDMATPGMIYWGGPPMVQAEGLGGMGGGGADCILEDSMCGGGAEKTGIGGGIDQSGVTTLMPFPQPPVPNLLPDLQPQPTEPARNAIAAEPVTGTGPILGVRPDAEQGAVLPDTFTATAPLVASDMSEPRSTGQLLLIAAGVLLALAIGLMITAILIKRKLLR
jgi:hypothetical protein